MSEDEKLNKKGKPLLSAALLAFLAGGGGSAAVMALFLNLHDPRPDPHTSTDDKVMMQRANELLEASELRLTRRIEALEESYRRHVNQVRHCQTCE